MHYLNPVTLQWGPCGTATLYAANSQSYTYFNLESHYAGQNAANNHTGAC